MTHINHLHHQLQKARREIAQDRKPWHETLSDIVSTGDMSVTMWKYPDGSFGFYMKFFDGEKPEFVTGDMLSFKK